MNWHNRGSEAHDDDWRAGRRDEVTREQAEEFLRDYFADDLPAEPAEYESALERLVDGYMESQGVLRRAHGDRD